MDTVTAKFFASLSQEDLIHDANSAMTLYMSERNGLLLWRVLKQCHEAGEPIPENVIAKFSEWAGKLESAQNAREIAKALDLSGDGKAHKGGKQLDAAHRRQKTASEVETVKKLYSLNIDSAIKTVAKNSGRLESSVKSDYYVFFNKRKPGKNVGNIDEMIRREWRS